MVGDMSPIGLVLQERFESGCRSELQRLHKKTAALTDIERAQVAALALDVTRSLAGTLAAAVGRARVPALALEVTSSLAGTLDAAVAAPGRAGIAPVVVQLFAGTGLTP